MSRVKQPGGAVPSSQPGDMHKKVRAAPSPVAKAGGDVAHRRVAMKAPRSAAPAPAPVLVPVPVPVHAPVAAKDPVLRRISRKVTKQQKIEHARRRARAIRIIRAASEESSTNVIQCVHVRDVLGSRVRFHESETRIRLSAVETMREIAMALLDSILMRSNVAMQITGAMQLSPARVLDALKMTGVTAEVQANSQAAINNALKAWKNQLAELNKGVPRAPRAAAAADDAAEEDEEEEADAEDEDEEEAAAVDQVSDDLGNA